MFIAKILLANVLVPTVVSTVSALTSKISRDYLGDRPAKGPEPHAEPDRASLDSLLGAVAAALAIWLAFGLQNGYAFYPPDDSWLRIPTGTILVALAAMLTAPVGEVLKWSVRLGCLLAASWIVFPTGEAWEFLQPSRNYWLAALSMSSWIGWLCIERRAARPSGVLALTWIPCFAAAAFLTSQSFMKVTEPLMAVSSVIGCMGIAVLIFRRSQLVHGAAGPCLFASAAAIANAQFNSYLGLSDFLSGLAMFGPAIVALSGLPWVPRRGEQPTPSKALTGFVVTVVACLVVCAAIVIWTQLVSGGGDEEW